MPPWYIEGVISCSLLPVLPAITMITFTMDTFDQINYPNWFRLGDILTFVKGGWVFLVFHHRVDKTLVTKPELLRKLDKEVTEWKEAGFADSRIKIITCYPQLLPEEWRMRHVDPWSKRQWCLQFVGNKARIQESKVDDDPSQYL